MRIKYCSICKAAPLFQYTVSKMLRDRASRNCLWSCFSGTNTFRAPGKLSQPDHSQAVQEILYKLPLCHSLTAKAYSLIPVLSCLSASEFQFSRSGVELSPPLKIPRWNFISSSRSRINISLDMKFPLNPWFIWLYRTPGLPSYKEHLVTYPSLPHPWKWHFSPCACLMVKSEGRESGLPRQLIKHCFWARLWGCFQKTLSFHSLLLSFLSIVGCREIKWYLLLHLLSKITWPSKSTLFLAMFMACDKVGKSRYAVTWVYPQSLSTGNSILPEFGEQGTEIWNWATWTELSWMD